MASTVVALYDDMETARQVVSELRERGIPQEDISLAAHDATGEYGRALDQTGTDDGGDRGDGAKTGAGIGAVLGGLGGLLVGLGALAIPGIGPILAAGPLATALAGLVGAGVGAVAGGAAGGIIGALVDMGLPEEQAGYYAEGVRRGGALVTVQAADDSAADLARDIMNQYDAVDINERAQAWRAEGWQGYNANAQPYSPEQISREREQYREMRGQTLEQGDEARLPVVEEELRVGKRDVERGGVQVHKRVTETPVQETVNLREEHVRVERRPVNQPIDPARAEAELNAFEEGQLDVTERREEPVVQKTARVTEEVVVRKDVENRQETVQDTVRRTDVDVRQTEAGTDDMSRYATAWRGHYQSSFANSGYQYEHFEPAYQYGYQLRNEAQYRDYDWERLEPEARRTWEQRNPGTWERIRDAVRYSWEGARQRARD